MTTEDLSETSPAAGESSHSSKAGAGSGSGGGLGGLIRKAAAVCVIALVAGKVLNNR